VDNNILQLEDQMHEQRLLSAIDPAPEPVGLLQGLRPFQILTLEDMLPFYPSNLYLIARNLRAIQKDIMNEPSVDMHFKPPSEELAAAWEQVILELTEAATQVGLRRTLERLSRFRPEYHKLGCGEIFKEAQELDLAIVADFTDYKFFYLPSDQAKYYEIEDIFNISAQFPTAAVEVRLAGNCYATGNSTACVFHLMRAVEIGAKSLVKLLGAQKYLNETVTVKGKKQVVKKPVELCDWNKLLIGINQALEVKKRGTKTNLAKKEFFEFCSHAVAQLSNFKDAWRNRVSHSNKIYGAGEARDIMENTRQFLQNLATRVTE